MVAGWVPLGRMACTEAKLGVSSKSGGSEGASCGPKIGAAGHTRLQAPMVAGWVALGRMACTEAKLGVSSKSGGSEGASCGPKVGAAGHTRSQSMGRGCQGPTSSTRVSGSSRVSSAQLLCMM